MRVLGEEEPMDPLLVAMRSMELALIPSGVMLAGSIFTVLLPEPPPKMIAHALQHLAAGIVLCAISTELIPPLSQANDSQSIIGLILGFCLGVATMISLSIFLEPDEEEDEVVSEPEVIEEEEPLMRSPDAEFVNDEAPLNDYSDRAAGETELRCVGRNAVPQGRPASKEGSEDSKHSRSLINQARRLAEGSDASRPFPLLFAMCVYIDSVMDGLLVGISLIAGKSAGLFMAVALCVEMGFLGLTFAAACTGQPKYKAIPGVVAGPLFLMCGACLGGLLANALAANLPALIACTSFGVAALLYMVCEELLVSAHEEGEEHVWWVDLQVFVGFLLALLLDKAVQGNDT
mmetsp:Transcript_23575/g.52967  ORF Transcript_23575/g.52967 Transcript_23575/m.52967 type:complete len:347 (-) Transcript_23575:428-1468(-)